MTTNVTKFTSKWEIKVYIVQYQTMDKYVWN